MQHAEGGADSSSDLAEAYPNGELHTYYRADWLSAMIKDTKSNRDFQARTIDTARWAREQVKRQTNLQTMGAA